LCKTRRYFFIVLLLTIFVSNIALATEITTFSMIMPDGTVINNVGNLDFAPGSGLVVNANPFGPGGAGSPIQVLFQAFVAAIQGPSYNDLTPPLLRAPFVSGGYEFTTIARVWETPSGLGGSVALFNLADDPTGTHPNVIELWADSTGLGGNRANVLAGTGFSDGVLALRAIPISLGGIFYGSDTNGNGLIDNQDTGVGSTDIVAVVTYADPVFFNFSSYPVGSVIKTHFIGTTNTPPEGVNTVTMWDGTVPDYFGMPDAIGGPGTPQTTNDIMFKMDGTTHFTPTLTCIDLIKEVSNDGVTWHDANDPQCSDAPGTLDPAHYRLRIKNCGGEELTNLVINDSVLGITNFPVGSNLPVGGPDIVLTSAQIAQLNNPNLCPIDPNNPNVVNGGLRNIARVDAEGITSGIDVFDEDPACIKCVCIDLIKEVSNDGLTWHDANDPQCDDAPGTLDPAYYRLRIKNCGGEELTDIVINDPVLGITNFPVGSNLPVGGNIVLTSAQIAQLSNPNLCPIDPNNPNVVNGGLRNIARVDAEGITSGIAVFDEDPACIKCVCIDLVKEVSNDGLTWHDANDPQCSDAPGTLDPAYYRLTIKNCGGEELTSLVINDPVLGITNFPVGSNLPVGGPDIVLTSAQIAQLNNPNLCPLDPNNPNVVNGGLRNIARVDAEGVSSGIDVFDEDPACIKCSRCCLEIVKTATPVDLTCIQGLWWLTNRCKCCKTFGCIDKCCTVPKVKYTYKTKNLCDPVKNVKVVDNKFGTIATIPYLGTGQEKIITKTKCVCNTTTNIATVKGYLVSDPVTFCTDSDTETVTVSKPW
jgi:hypothetical protein